MHLIFLQIMALYTLSISEYYVRQLVLIVKVDFLEVKLLNHHTDCDLPLKRQCDEMFWL